MYIEDYEAVEVIRCESVENGVAVDDVWDWEDDRNDDVGGWDAKRVLIGAGARALFYPTLVYNVVRNKVQSEFRWWDRIDKFLLLGAVPFPSDVLRLKELGVHGVITLNEPYETLVPTSLYHVFLGNVIRIGVLSPRKYTLLKQFCCKKMFHPLPPCVQAHDIYHLVLPTRDYLFAPSMNDICQAVDFIHRNASRGWMTYVHCKAGRGRSTTIVLCYLVQHKQMTPEDAYSYVRSIRPRVHLASSQWQAVKDYYNYVVKSCGSCARDNSIIKSSGLSSVGNLFEFDDCSVVVVTKSDIDGYDTSQPTVEGSHILADLSVIYKVRVASQAALARLSCLWLRCHTQQKIAEEQLLRQGSCTITADQISGSLTVDIHVY